MLFRISKNINSKHLIAFAALCFYVYNFSLGLELTPDSFSYLSGAKNILQGKGYIDDCNEKAIRIFPPVYSIFLIPFLKFGAFSSNGIIISSIFLFIASIILLMNLKILSLNSWNGIMVFIVILSFLFFNQHHLLSETLFIPLFIIWYFFNCSNKKKSKVSFLGVLVLEILLISTRYSAFLIIASFYFIEFFFDFIKRNEKKEEEYLPKYLIPIISFCYFLLLQGGLSNWEYPHISNMINHINTGYSIVDYIFQVAYDLGDNIYGQALSFQLQKKGILIFFICVFIFLSFYSFHIQISKRAIYYILLLLIIHIAVLYRGGAGDPLRGRFLFWIYTILILTTKISQKPHRLFANYLIYFLLLSHLMSDFYFFSRRFQRSKNFIYSRILSKNIDLNAIPIRSQLESEPKILKVNGKMMLVYPCYKSQL